MAMPHLFPDKGSKITAEFLGQGAAGLAREGETERLWHEAAAVLSRLEEGEEGVGEESSLWDELWEEEDGGRECDEGVGL